MESMRGHEEGHGDVEDMWGHGDNKGHKEERGGHGDKEGTWGLEETRTQV